MIRKPTEQDFKEGAAVTVLRESKRVAQASGEGAGRGLQTIMRPYLYGVFWLGVLTTAIPAMASGRILPGLLLIAGAYGLQQLFRKGLKGSAPFLARGRPAAPEPIRSEDMLLAAQRRLPSQADASAARSPRKSGDFKLRPAAAVRQAMSLLIPGMLLSFLGIGFIIALLPGLLMVVTALLILLKAGFDRDLLHFDHRAVTVNALLAKKTVAWADVLDVSAKVHPWYSGRLLITIGSRRTIVLTVRDPRGGVRNVMVPMDLLDLDREGLTRLVADMLCCRAAAGEIVPSWQPAPRMEAPVPKAHPACDPRESFDADAIMARYLAERERTIADARPDLRQNAATAPRTFGRKIA